MTSRIGPDNIRCACSSRARSINLPCTHRRPGRPRAQRSDRLGPGRSAAPGDQRLSLLPSGPDEVHTSPLRGTRSSTSISPSASASAGLGWEFSPAGADCRYRAPLVPRLARPTDSTGGLDAAFRSRPQDSSTAKIKAMRARVRLAPLSGSTARRSVGPALERRFGGHLTRWVHQMDADPAWPAVQRMVDPLSGSRSYVSSTHRVGVGCECGGEGGIRTHDELPHTAFPVPRPRPLGDLSAGQD